MTQREESDSGRSWTRVVTADLGAVGLITGLVEWTGWPPLVGLLGLPIGAYVYWRWAP